jgi:CO/xanthine dehydrogenase FAD-binding subunit
MTVDGEQCQDVRIALSAVGPTPFRARKAEEVLRGEILNAKKGDLISKAARQPPRNHRPLTI